MSNLILRILFAAVAIPVTLFAVFKGGNLLRIFVSLLLLGGGVEMYRITREKGFPIFLPAALLGILIFCFRSTYFLQKTEDPLLFPLLFLVMFAVITIEVFRADVEKGVIRAGLTVLTVLYIGFLGSYLIAIGDSEALKNLGFLQTIKPKFNGALLIMFLLAVWGSDTFAYFLGRLIGGKLLLPRVSPKKTVAGLFGSLGGGIAGLLVGRTFFEPHFPSISAVVIIGVLIGVFGQVGDLFESLIKRFCGVKDSSGIFPGHGGILDRLDAIIFCAPIYYYALMFVH